MTGEATEIELEKSRLLLRKSCVCGRYFRGAKGDIHNLGAIRAQALPEFQLSADVGLRDLAGQRVTL